MLTASGGGSPGLRTGQRRTASSSFTTRMLAGVVRLPASLAWNRRRNSSCQMAISSGLLALLPNAK